MLVRTRGLFVIEPSRRRERPLDPLPDSIKFNHRPPSPYCFRPTERLRLFGMEASFYWAWAISALAIALLGLVLGKKVKAGGGWLGILIDNRGRYSLTHFQVVLWTLVVLSLISALFWGRLIEGVSDPLGFSIPAEVLGLLGISLGSGLASTV